MSYSYFKDLYTKVIQNWGSESSGFIFKGYKDNALMCTKTLSPSMKFSLSYDLKNQTLNLKDDAYVVTRLSIKHIDQNNSLLNYSFLPLIIEASNNLEVIGPNIVSLNGGQTSIYIKAIKKGFGKIKIKSELETKIIKIKIK